MIVYNHTPSNDRLENRHLKNIKRHCTFMKVKTKVGWMIRCPIFGIIQNITNQLKCGLVGLHSYKVKHLGFETLLTKS